MEGRRLPTEIENRQIRLPIGDLALKMGKRKHQEDEDSEGIPQSQAKKRGSQSQEDEFSESEEEADAVESWGCRAGMVEYVKYVLFIHLSGLQ